MTSSSSRPAELDDILITTGIVTATGTHATGGTIMNGATQAHLRLTPVVWLEDEDGVSHSFEGASFAAVCEGHELVVVRKRSNAKVIRVYNQAALTAIDSADLIPLNAGPNNLLSGTLMLAILGILPAVLVYTAVAISLRETVLGRDPSTFSLEAHFPFLTILLLAFCFWLMKKLIARSRAKAAALSALVNSAVSAQVPSTKEMCSERN